MTQPVALTINGRRREDHVEPRLLLVHYLREVAGLTGTHIACDTSQCGACTVLIDGEAVKSCSVFAVQADGRQVTTDRRACRGRHPASRCSRRSGTSTVCSAASAPRDSSWPPPIS